jgi:hypothetical protein
MAHMMIKNTNPIKSMSRYLGIRAPRIAPTATIADPLKINHHILMLLIFSDFIIIPKYIGKGIMPKIRLEAVPVMP